MSAPRTRPFPGVVWGEYPQRDSPASAVGLRAFLRGLKAVAPPRIGRYEHFARKLAARPADARPLAVRLQALRDRLALAAEWDNEGLEEAFALAVDALESSQGIRAYPSQVMAARIMLDDRLAEMATGEGKTVAIALAAAIAALGNTPVHVITANDYLASRDAQAMSPFFTALGLSAGVVTQPLSQAQRRAEWGRDVTYCTAKELAFDYLRDGMARPQGLADLQRRARRLSAAVAPNAAAAPQPLLRGLCMAIVDEADTVLIDEASVPLVLSQAGSDLLDPLFLAQAASQAASLREGVHYRLAGGSVALMADGRERLLAWPQQAKAPPTHNDRRHREDAVQLALTSQHVLQRDRDYVVKDGKVTLIDATTGRAAEGRAWSRGLHQLVELKEGCELTGRNNTVLQITFQRFFPRYLRLAGMSGTVRGSAGEMLSVYGLATVRVPTRLPSRRRKEPVAVFADTPALWQAVARRTQEVHSSGRPVLIGTGSVAESEQLSAVLTLRGLTHAVLNARQDGAEGEVVAAAGLCGRITVATSMAGRGTDIHLGEGVAALGGLHVILCQHNASRRIDRQFIGRAGRRGEPGSVQVMLALDFVLARRWLPAWWRNLAVKPGLSHPLLELTALWPQWLATYTQRKQREALCRNDEETGKSLTFNRETFS